MKSQEQQEREETFLLVEGKTGMKVKFLKNEIIKQKINKGMLERSLAKAIKERVGMPYYIDGDTYEELVEIQIQLEDGVISFLTNKKMLFSSTTYIFILWMFGSSLLLFAIATIFMRNQIRPIRRLAIAANNFGKGKNITNFSSGGAREVRLASAAFQNMKTRIQRQMKQRTEMLAGVSHDLNTILTRMKLEIELMKENDPDKNNLSSDIFEMKKMRKSQSTHKKYSIQLSRTLELEKRISKIDVCSSMTRCSGDEPLSVEKDTAVVVDWS